jgi:glycosyltransferase involved in cell wall biosynthesis
MLSSTSTEMNVHFLIPGDINTLTGGYVYDKIITDGLRLMGYNVTIHSLTNDFPFPSAKSLDLCNLIFAGIPLGEIIFIDSLAFGPLYKILERNSGRNIVIPIIHLPLSKNPKYDEVTKKLLADLENRAFYYATYVIAVSEFTKQLIVEYGVSAEKIKVITPGVFDVPRKTIYPDFPRRLLCVGSYLPAKGQSLLVQALSQLQDIDWTLTMHGIQDFDTEYSQLIKSHIIDCALEERIFMKKEISGNELIEAYLQADLFVLPSFFENFSMALNDSLMHGIPVITTTAGGISFSVPKSMGLFVSPGNVCELKKAIQELLTNRLLYGQLCSSASEYYKTANIWENSINLFHSLLQNCLGLKMIIG